MLVIPAIDLREGKCVRLIQGQAEKMTVYSEDPVAVAKMFEREGARLIHIVDLDGAFVGTSRNLRVVEAICGAVSCQVELGGGIRTMEDVERVLAAGVARVILGTVAVNGPDFVEEVARRFGEAVVVGIDARGGKVATKGWVETSEIQALELAEDMKRRGVREIIYTDIAKDGTMSGPNLVELENITRSGLSVIASGGVSSLDDLAAISRLEKKGVRGAIVGKALYDGVFTVSEAIAALAGRGEM